MAIQFFGSNVCLFLLLNVETLMNFVVTYQKFQFILIYCIELFNQN